MTVKKRLPELDCLRGIAATMVMIFHFTLGHPNLQVLGLGLTGVELFFVISGFVIFLTIERTASYKSFLLSRFARLYPAYWVCVTLTTACIILWSWLVKVPIHFPHLTDYLVNITMFQYYTSVKSIDGVYWTLAVEMLFYFFILLIYLFKLIRKIEFVGFLTVLFCLLFETVVKTSAYPLYVVLGRYLPILLYFPLFMAGIVFYKIKFHNTSVYRLLLLALCLITQILLFSSTGKIQFITQFQYAIAMGTIFLVFLLYCFNKLNFIVNGVTSFMGSISYSLYLIHGYISVFILIPILTHSRYFHINFWIAVLFIVTPIMLIAATLINKLVEVPAMRYIKRKFQ